MCNEDLEIKSKSNTKKLFVQQCESSKKRENWIDWSKTILIWLMVLGHAGLNGIPRDFVYAFHMPAFFIISGYLYKPHTWFRTLKGFGMPIIFFSAINLCYVILRFELKGESILDGDLLFRITPPLLEM